MQCCINSIVQFSVVRSVDDGKEEEKEELPNQEVDNRGNVDLAAFGVVEDVATEQSQNVALVPTTPRSKPLEERSNVIVAVLLRFASFQYSVGTTKYTRNKRKQNGVNVVIWLEVNEVKGFEFLPGNRKEGED